MRSVAEEQIVRVTAGGVALEGNLAVPPDAHGSGSSRHSPRNRVVAEYLQRSALGTLLIDLLTGEEEEIDDRTRHLRFDTGLLADRLAGAAGWARNGAATRGLPIGYFGASTGGGAALVAAAQAPEGIGAVVSRGDRPDLAGRFLPLVEAPTQLIVGGADSVVIDLNRAAYDELRCAKELQIVPGATHLFQEPGALERVAELAAGWFTQWLG